MRHGCADVRHRGARLEDNTGAIMTDKTRGDVAADNERRVREFFAAWELDFPRFCASFEEIMSEDCLLIQSGIPDVRGPRQAIALLGAGHEYQGIESIRVEVLRLLATDVCVVSERIDHLLRADGGLIVSIPVAGVMDIAAGKIAAWREYFDSKLMDGLPGARLLA
jgi:limonene-1,2-epoxide hydrolase